MHNFRFSLNEETLFITLRLSSRLKTDYVKSIPLRHAVDPIEYLEDFDGDIYLLLQEIYDKECLPEAMLTKGHQIDASKTGIGTQ